MFLTNFTFTRPADRSGWQIPFVPFPLGNLNARTIYVINADGTGKHAVHPGPGPQIVPAWQPRGDRIDQGF